jgi:phosphate uptake regulator
MGTTKSRHVQCSHPDRARPAPTPDRARPRLGSRRFSRNWPTASSCGSSPPLQTCAFLPCVLRVVPELERSHHLVVQLASRANHIRGEDLSPRSRQLVEHMGNLASGMWREAADCWCERDRSAAVALDEREEMDESYAGLMAEFASGEMTLPVTRQLTLVARFYERLADHAFNIARRVIYLAGQAH